MAVGCDDNENGDNGEDERDNDDGSPFQTGFIFSLVF